MPSAAIQAAPKAAALSMTDELNFANMVAAGNLVPQQYQNNPANILIAVNLGQAMGLGPAESLYRINVIKGKPTASAELIAAQVRKAGHKLRIEKDDARQSVTATVIRADDPDYPISETRDIAWAKRMGLAGSANYQRQPMTMLTWRAITAVAREACPEALYGVAYTPDEMSDMDPQPAQQVASTSEPVAKPRTKRNTAEWMRPVRRLYKPWKAARGLDDEQAMAELQRATGATSMATMNAGQATKAADLMRSQIAAAEEPEPEEAKGEQPSAEDMQAREAEEAAPTADDGSLYDADVEW